MKRIEICDRCKREFYRQFVNGKNNWSQLNEVNYWTEGKDWNNYKILCRACLIDWKTKHTNEFIKLVSQEKKKRFSNYQTNRVLDRQDLA